MSGMLTMTVHLSEDEADHGSDQGEQAFACLKAELTEAFAVSESSYQPLSAAEIIARNQS